MSHNRVVSDTVKTLYFVGIKFSGFVKKDIFEGTEFRGLCLFKDLFMNMYSFLFYWWRKTPHFQLFFLQLNKKECYVQSNKCIKGTLK